MYTNIMFPINKVLILYKNKSYQYFHIICIFHLIIDDKKYKKLIRA